MSNIAFIVVFALVVIETLCDNDNSVEVCTTLNVPNYNTRSPQNIDDTVKSGIDGRLTALEEKLDQLLTTLTNQQSDYNEIVEDAVTATAFHSCEEIHKRYPNSSSGLYNITSCHGHQHAVYCSMENTCGDAEGGWMRVAYLNMSDPNEQCPPGFKLYDVNGIRACGSMKTGCNSTVKFSTNNIAYSQVCGRVTGYQKGAPDALLQYAGYKDINQPYVDGVSITRGNPRQHIWTFMAAIQENFFYNSGHLCCPCAPNSPVTLPAFMGSDYFCESGCPGSWDTSTFHSNDPLWDGKQCGLIEKSCCNAAGIPWFNKVLQQTTTDDIELRVCIDQSPTGNEDSPVSYYEIYVK